MTASSDFCDSYGDHRVALNFLEQVGFYADRIVIEEYRHYVGHLPSIIIRVGWSTEPADPRDLEILAELADEFGQPERHVSDAVLEVPAGRLIIQGAYLPREPEQLELPFERPTEVEVADESYLHPTIKDILNRWRRQAQ